MKFTKIAAVISGLLVVALVVAIFIEKSNTLANQSFFGFQNENIDTSDNNREILLTRPSNWKKIIDTPVIDLPDMNVIDGSTATIPITAELLRQFYGFSDKKVEESHFTRHNTTHIAYENLINYYNIDELSNTVRLIFVTPPSESEKEQAKEKNVELDLTPIANDGFVFITHKNNPVDSLTVEEIQLIYMGLITNWSQLGGEDLEIKAYQREENSGSQTAMEQLVMQGKEMMKPLMNTKVNAMDDLVDFVADYKNDSPSIGYTYYYYINNLYKNEDIKVLKVNGFAPTNDNLINNTYPFTTNYYAVMRGDEPENSPARKLRDFLISPKGQDLIAMAGYCKAVN